MFSNKQGLFNPSLLSQEYFEQILSVVYGKYKVKSIVPFAFSDKLIPENGNKIYFGFVRTTQSNPFIYYGQAVGGHQFHPTENLFVGDGFQTVSTHPDLVLFHGSLGENPLSFIGWCADVEKPSQLSDDTTPIYTGFLKASVLKAAWIDGSLWFLVQTAVNATVVEISGYDSTPVNAGITWTDHPDTLQSALYSPATCLLKAGTLRNEQVINFAEGGIVYKANVTPDGNSLAVQILPNSALPQDNELAVLKLVFKDNFVTHATVYINHPTLSAHDGNINEYVHYFGGYPFAAGKRCEITVGYNIGGPVYFAPVYDSVLF